jgi:hypothetical protein
MYEQALAWTVTVKYRFQMDFSVAP